MSTLTLPLVAGAPFDGRAWFAARTVADVDPAEAVVLWHDKPVLTDRTLRWCTDAEVPCAHVALTLPVAAELLFSSPLNVNDRFLTDAQLLDTVVGQLDACGCDIGSCVALLVVEYDDHPEVAAPRMARCLELAARIVRTDVTA